MLQITMITTALLAIVNIWIGFRAVQIRARDKILIGDAGNPSMIARMRAHSNFSEYVPLAVILMGLIEMAGGARTGLIVAGGALLIARIAHPLGMDRPAPNVFRAGGMLTSVLVTIALAGWALAIAYA